MKNHKMFLIWLVLLMVAIGYALVNAQPVAKKPNMRHPGYGPSKIMLSNEPQLNSVITVTYIITPSTNIENMKITVTVVSGAELIAGNNDVKIINSRLATSYYKAKKDTPIRCSFKARVLSSPFRIGVRASAPWLDKNGKEQRGGSLGGADIERVVVDEKTGQLGTLGEKYKGIEYHYDVCDGSFTKEPQIGAEEYNRKIIALMKKLEPTLTDSEALCLHSDKYKAGEPYGYKPKGSEKENWRDDSELFKYYLDNGWLKAFRGGNRDLWNKEMNKKIKKSWEDKKKSEITPENIDNPKATMQLVFEGQWLYKDHKYDKNGGLLADYEIKPVKNAKARLMLQYYLGTTIRDLTAYCTTNDTGGFTITYDIDASVSQGDCYPIIYPSGPDPDNPAVSVSDPNITISSYWKDYDDPSLFPMRENGTPTPHLFYVNTITKSLGKLWTDTFPAFTQPQSGCINIYQTLVKGYDYLVPTYTSSSVLKKVRAMWEPGYPGYPGTCYRGDTIWVKGDTLLPDIDTDEWDDMVLLHEYGHHVMNSCADEPPNSVNPTGHQWYVADTLYKNQAYSEGWANLLPSIITDSIYNIDTYNKIGATPDVDYFNLENPWDFTPFPPDSFQAGPWCEGAVAGALWDIADFSDEIPYPSYPLLPSYPDTNLADSLDAGFYPVWNIFDNFYNNGHTPYTIIDFLCGWTNYVYGHPKAKNNIMFHHRIYSANSIPSTMPSLSQKTGLWQAVISWVNNLLPFKGAKTGIAGYNVYRKLATEAFYNKINTSIVTDTFYIDISTVEGNTYSYYITGVDSAGIESAPSIENEITIQHLPSRSTTPLATAYNNSKNLVCDTSGANLHLVYQSNNKIWYAKSADSGATWSADTCIGDGVYPTIALDKYEMPNVVWSKKISLWDGELYFSRFNGTSWTTPYVLGAFPLGKAVDLPKDIAPAIAISKSDTAFITWKSGTGGLARDYDIIYAGWFNSQQATPVLQYSKIDSVPALAYPCPTVALDSLGVVHYAWDDKLTPRRYAISYRKREINGLFTPKEEISSYGENIAPCLDFSRWQNSINAVWEGPLWPSVSYRSKLDTASSWNLIDTIDMTGMQPVTVAGGYAVFSRDGEIYVNRKVGNLWPDTAEINISNTTAMSNYPQACFSQTAGGSSLYVAWTEGDAAPYQIKFAKIAVPAVAKVYADVGGATASAYCLQRDGYLVFGPESYQTVDYDSEQLKYRFDGFKKDKKYSIKLVYYCEYGVAGQETKGGPRKSWTQELDIDGTVKHRTKLVSGERIIVEKNIPPAAYNKDGVIIVDINRITGDYAVCAEIYLYEYDKECEEDKSTATQSASLSTGIPIVNQLCQNAPNPFGSQPTIIQYAVTKPGNVSLKVYNISGQLVKTLVNEGKRAGYHNVRWNGKDESGRQAASGIYFYRLTSGQFSDTKKLVVLK